MNEAEKPYNTCIVIIYRAHVKDTCKRNVILRNSTIHYFLHLSTVLLVTGCYKGSESTYGSQARYYSDSINCRIIFVYKNETFTLNLRTFIYTQYIKQVCLLIVILV